MKYPELILAIKLVKYILHPITQIAKIKEIAQ
jgi:hypothetical protein